MYIPGYTEWPGGLCFENKYKIWVINRGGYQDSYDLKITSWASTAGRISVQMGTEIDIRSSHIESSPYECRWSTIDDFMESMKKGGCRIDYEETNLPEWLTKEIVGLEVMENL